MQTIRTKLNLSAAQVNRCNAPNIWADCPWTDIVDNVRNGVAYYDDFQDFPLIGTQTTQIAHGKYKVFATTGSSISRISTINSVEIAGGALQAATDTDNDSASIAQAYPTHLLSGLQSSSGKLWFEAVYAQNSLLTNMAAVMIGLAEVDQWTLATGVPFNGSDAITNSASFVGFRTLEDGLGVFDSVYSDRATSFTNIQAGVGTLSAAYTFISLGMKYDPADKEGKAIRFFVNNLEATTSFSNASLVALTNLKANCLGLIWATCADSAGTSFGGYLKGWRVAQVFDQGGGASP